MGTDADDLWEFFGVVLRAVPGEHPALAVGFKLVALEVGDDAQTDNRAARLSTYNHFEQTIVVQVNLATAGIVVSQHLVEAADGDVLGIHAQRHGHSCHKSK